MKKIFAALDEVIVHLAHHLNKMKAKNKAEERFRRIIISAGVIAERADGLIAYYSEAHSRFSGIRDYAQWLNPNLEEQVRNRRDVGMQDE